MSALSIAALLFDLDGTLVDTAPDLYAAASAMRADRGLPPLPYAAFRPQVSRGGRAMLAVAFPRLSESQREAMLEEFLARYHDAICVHSRLFDGVADLLDAIEARGLCWGIVTNKPGWLCAALLPALGLDRRCGALVAGDSLPVRKPDPGPVLTACGMLGVDAARVLFVGDDERDVQSGRAAGCRTAVAAWGYVPARSEYQGWGADLVLEHASELLDETGISGR